MASAKSYVAYVGCRTSKERNARGKGIGVFSVDASSGAWTHVQLLEGLVNPSFLALDHRQRVLYAVHGDSSEISAFRIDPNKGELAFINQQSTQGKNPVHLCIDPANRFVVVANHITTPEFSSGLAVLPLHEDGSLGPVVDHVPLKGKIGPHRVEQPFAKPHQVQYDRQNRFIVVPDKGLDLIYTFELDANGKLRPIAAPPPRARESAGPRHISFHPTLPYAYAINELDSTVAAYRFDPASGSLTPFQVLSSLPDSYVSDSRGSEIEVSQDGRFVYASNRGYDSIAIFSTEPGTGRLTPVGWKESVGKTPRFFVLDPSGKFMFVANEDSDTIVTFAVDQKTGALSDTGASVTFGSPVCIVFAERQ